MIQLLIKGNDYTKPMNPFRMVVDWKATAIGNPSYGGITKGAKPIMKMSPQKLYYPPNILTEEIYGD